MRALTFTEQVGALRRTLRRALIQRVASKSERPLNHLQALRLISRTEVQTQAELAQRLLIDAPAASRLVESLEREGLLKRTPGSDRRCVCLKATASAKAEIAVIDDAMDWLDAKVKAALTGKELSAAAKVLAKLQLSLT
jgi:DNA-binding MarR family transcriptional regulator